MSLLDFSCSTGLQHLTVSCAVRLNICAGTEVAVCPDLEPLLARITPHCPLHTLILRADADTIVSPPPWTPLPHLADLLASPQFAGLRELQVVVAGSPYCFEGSARLAREHLEPIVLAAIPSSANRRVVCVDGKDSDYVHTFT